MGARASNNKTWIEEMDRMITDIDLARYFSGNASAEEAENILSWRDETPANLEMFMAAQWVWKRTQQIQTVDFDTEEALNRVHDLIGNKGKLIIRTRNFYFRIAGMAAAVLLILVIFIGISRFYRKEVNKYQLVQSGMAVKYLKLADGTRIWLNKNSRLYLPVRGYQLKLDGEAYFQVAKDPNRIFEVEARGTMVKVLGTAFNLKTIATDSSSILSVTEGKVKCSIGEGIVTNIVEKGKTALCNLKNRQIQVEDISDVNLLSWKTRLLIFKDTPLQEVVRQLKDYYQIDIEIADTSLCRLKVTSTFKDFPAATVLKILELSNDALKIEAKGKGYKISLKP